MRNDLRRLHALLIGIDRYATNPWCGDLYGAVADVTAMRNFLLHRRVPPTNIRCLVSPSSGSIPSEKETQEAAQDQGCSNDRGKELPTFDAMVQAIEELGDRAAASEGEAFLHFSGHGARAKTWLPGVKGDLGYDEGLVPCDISKESPQLLRDLELTWLLTRITSRGVPVTLVVDACHAGGMARFSARRVWRRSAWKSLGDLPPGEDPIAPLADLEKVWRRTHHRESTTAEHLETALPRHGRAHVGWISEGLLEWGVVVVSACRSTEAAYEHDLGNGPRGALTFCLLESLERERTWEAIFRRLVCRMRRLSPPQRPLFEGEFGPLGAALLAVSRRQPQELRRPAAPARYPPFETWSHFHKRYLVALVVDEQRKAGPAWRDDRSKQGVELLQAVFERRGGKLLKLVTNEAPVPDLQVHCGPESFEIRWSGGASLPEIPTLVGPPEATARRCGDWLLHLACFFTLRDLSGPEGSTPEGLAAGRVSISLGLRLLPPDYQRGDPLTGEPLGEFPRIEAGRWIVLRITNREVRPLHFTIFDLRPDWGIEVLHPRRGIATLEPRQCLLLPLETFLPAGQVGGDEFLRVIATTEPTVLEDLNSLERLKTDNHRGAGTQSRFVSELEICLQAILRGLGDKRNGRDSRHRMGGECWATAQVEFEMVPRFAERDPK